MSEVTRAWLRQELQAWERGPFSESAAEAVVAALRYELEEAADPGLLLLRLVPSSMLEQIQDMLEGEE